jgi:opacity protein-like surface antigen
LASGQSRRRPGRRGRVHEHVRLRTVSHEWAQSLQPDDAAESSRSDYFAFSKFGNWYAVLAARAGVTGDAFVPGWSRGDRVLFYVKGGAAVARFGTGVQSSNFPGATFALINYSNTEAIWGLAAGGGVEWAWSDRWSLKAEYEYLGFAHTTHACGPLTSHTGVIEVPSSIFCSETAVRGINTAKLGLAYRLWPF